MSTNQMTLPAVPEAPNGMAAMMERLALNPELPVDKLEKLLDMQIKIRAIEAEQEYSAAMARVQAAMPVVLKDAYNTQTSSPYATVTAIAAAIKPIYTAEGFSISFSEAASTKPDHIRVRGTVRHRAGHKDDTPYTDVAIDKAGIKGNDNKTLTHAEGSSFTYGRRYLTCMVFDVATGNDTDGNQPKSATTVSADQLTALEDKIAETNANRGLFLAWIRTTTKRPVENLTDVPGDFWQKAMDQLDVVASKKSTKK